MSITLNPGFALICGAAMALIMPRSVRAGVMIGWALAALALIYVPDFGLGPAFAQIGLSITPLRLDPLAQIFGTGFALIALLLALFSADREDKAEDVALMAHAGGALVAVFAGDLVSFVAGAQFSALASAALIFRGTSAGALGAGLRYLSWQVLAGALMTAGIGFTWASAGAIGFDRMNPLSIQGGLMLAGLVIMAGAPIAHVWVKDSLPHASTIGMAALAAFPIKLGIYALARGFPGEPALLYLGAIAALGAVPLAAMSRDVRQSAAYGIISQAGAAIAAIGAGTPFALASAAALAFASLFHGTLGLLAIGLACARIGSARESALGGLARSMPMTAILSAIAALSAIGAPGFIGFAANTIHGDALAQEDRPLVWLALIAASAGSAFHLGGRLTYVTFFGPDRGQRPLDAQFSAQLAMGLAAFFCIAIGVAPSWLYGLLPAQIYFHPYDWDHIVRQGEIISFAWLALGIAIMARLFPADHGAELVELDWLLRRVAKRVLNAAGRALLAIYDGGRVRTEAAYAWAMKSAAPLMKEGDRPAAPDGAGLAWAMVVLTIAMVFLFAFQG